MKIFRCVNCMNEMEEGENICHSCGYDNSAPCGNTYSLPPNTILHGRYLIGKILEETDSYITYIGLDLEYDRKVAVVENYPKEHCTRDNRFGTHLVWDKAPDFDTVDTFREASFEHEGISFDPGMTAPVDPGITAPVEAGESMPVDCRFIENNTGYNIINYDNYKKGLPETKNAVSRHVMLNSVVVGLVICLLLFLVAGPLLSPIIDIAAPLLILGWLIFMLVCVKKAKTADARKKVLISTAVALIAMILLYILSR